MQRLSRRKFLPVSLVVEMVDVAVNMEKTRVKSEMGIAECHN